MKIIIEVKRSLANTTHNGEIKDEDGSVLGSFEIDDGELQQLKDSGVLDDTQNELGENVFKGCFEKIPCE